MLHSVLAEYLTRIEHAILLCRNAYVERYTEEILTPNGSQIRGQASFRYIGKVEKELYQLHQEL